MGEQCWRDAEGTDSFQQGEVAEVILQAKITNSLIDDVVVYEASDQAEFIQEQGVNLSSRQLGSHASVVRYRWREC